MFHLGSIGDADIGSLYRGEEPAEGETNRVILGVNVRVAICTSRRKAWRSCAGEHGAEIDRIMKLRFHTLDKNRGAEGDIGIYVVRKRQTKVNRFDLCLDPVVATYPVALIFGLEAKGRSQ
ncbi:hypothetical protein D3C75_289460 [compost metagenome]